MQLTAQLLQVFGLLPHLLAGTLIAGGDADALRQQQLQQRRVADADTDDCYALAAHVLYIFMQRHVILLHPAQYCSVHYTSLAPIVQQKNAPRRMRFFRLRL